MDEKRGQDTHFHEPSASLLPILEDASLPVIFTPVFANS